MHNQTTALTHSRKPNWHTKLLKLVITLLLSKLLLALWQSRQLYAELKKGGENCNNVWEK